MKLPFNPAFVSALCSLLVGCSMAPFSERTAGEAGHNGQPNIIYIMADELGYHELSILGHPHLKTPNIDQMAAEGMRFTHAMAGSSLCAPTRCTLMTGKHSGHTSVRTNGGGTPLRAGETTIASVLQQAGYATGGFGKWGCGGRGSTGVPEDHGFDVFFGYYDQVHAHSYYPPYLIRNSEEVALPGNNGGRSGQTYSHYQIVDAAREFIRDHADRPFFCYMPVTPPHGLFDLPEDDPSWALFRDQDWPSEAKRYAAMVHMLDRQVGEIFDLLEELAIEHNTIVVFCGDNGGQDYFRSKETPRGFHGPNVNPQTGVEFRGQKGTLYEGGLRIPAVVRWPGQIEAGQVSDHQWYFPDMMPTLLGLAGLQTPADSDGISIEKELLGQPDEQLDHQYMYWELGARRAVRMNDWKAILPARGKPWALYQLSTDPSESHDLSQQQPQILEQLQAYAEEAHQPVQEGSYGDNTLHQRDRLAKRGFNK